MVPTDKSRIYIIIMVLTYGFNINILITYDDYFCFSICMVYYTI